MCCNVLRCVVMCCDVLQCVLTQMSAAHFNKTKAKTVSTGGKIANLY
jgi:hypothetical protein